MNFLLKLGTVSNKSLIFYLKYNIRAIHITNSILADAEVSSKNADETFIIDELREPELTEDEINRKRFKSRLPERIYRKFVTKEPVPIEAKYDFQLNRLQAYYARFGHESNINPGICWPTRQEILDTIEFEREFEPPLQVRLKNIEEVRLAEEKRKKDVEVDVDKNMANLDKWVGDYHAKIAKRKTEISELKLKKERLVEEISEYLGYDIDPRDPRFQEAVEQKQKEKKKALKVKKQQESYEKMVAKLRKMAEKNS